MGSLQQHMKEDDEAELINEWVTKRLGEFNGLDEDLVEGLGDLDMSELSLLITTILHNEETLTRAVLKLARKEAQRDD